MKDYAGIAPRITGSVASLSALAVCLGFGSVAGAQTAPTGTAGVSPAAPSAPAPVARDDGSHVEEIVVTAQRRAENLQNVPISISAVTSATASANGIRTASDLAVAVPSLNVQKNSAATIFFIRGIGTAFGSPGLDSTIATFIDGVYIPSMSGANLSLNNIDRIEVLKGPQGTLYGRNATGGAISVVTRTPSETTSIEGSVGYGNKDTFDGNFYGTTGIAKGVAIDLAAYYHDQADGFGYDATNHQEVNKSKELALRSKLLVQLGDSTKFTLAGDYENTISSYGIAFRAVPSSTLLDGEIGYHGGYFDTDTDGIPIYRTKQYGVSGTLERDFGDVKFTSITAYRYQKGYQSIDVDTTPLDILQAPLHTKDGQFTEEARLSYHHDKLSLVGGIFYLHSYNRYDPFEIDGVGVAPLSRLVTYDRQGTNSIAAFGQGTYEVLPKTNLTLGFRYTRDERNFQATQLGVIGGATIPITAPISEKATFSKPTWRAALDHKFDNGILGYVSYSRGFKSGVYNLSSPGDPVVKPETLDAYEIGMKSDLFDRHLRFNPAFFYYDYKNIQLNQDRGVQTLILNAATAKIYGVDAEFDVVVDRHFSAQAGVGWTHGRYGTFLGNPTTTPNPVPPFGNISVPGPASGNQMILMPTWTANGSITYKTGLANGEIAANLAAVYNGGFYWAADNRERQSAYTLINAQLMWTAPGAHYNLRLWSRNLTNQHYLLTLNENTTGDIGAPAAGRTFGGSVGFKF